MSPFAFIKLVIALFKLMIAAMVAVSILFYRIVMLVLGLAKLACRGLVRLSRYVRKLYQASKKPDVETPDHIAKGSGTTNPTPGSNY